MTGEQFLMLPGPTPLPDRVARAMSKPMINHRGPEFKQILLDCTDGVKKVYRTKQNVVIFPASGTGALEAAVVNFISPGDKVLAVSIGVFGDRFAQIAGEFGANVEKLAFEWGTPADPQLVRDRIKADVNKEIKAVLVTQNETSTGVFNNIKAIREAVGDHPALVMVDAVSGLAALNLRMDEWKLDVVVSGSQKAFMIPPGLSFLAFNDRAFKVHEKCKNPRYYWDVTSAVKYLDKGQNPYTPAISLYYGLHEALQMMLDEGLDNILTRHMNYRDMARTAVRAMNLQPLAVDEAASPALTSVIAPEDIGANKIRKYLQDEFNIVLAGGQQKLDNVIFRIGHLGYIRELDLLAVLAALEIALLKFGHHLELGAGVNQAQQFLLKKHS